MAYLGEIIKRVESVRFLDCAFVAADATSEDIEKAQRDQMQHGYRRTGDIIGTYKDKMYAQMKEAMNPKAHGTVDLLVTGDFYREIVATVYNNEVIIESFDEKAGEILAQYKESIYGLGGQFKKEYVHGPFKKAFMQYLRNTTGLL